MIQLRNPAGDLDRFRQLVLSQVGGVLSEFGFTESTANVLDPGMWVHFKNKFALLDFYFEYCDGVRASIHRLTGSGDMGQGYGLDELLLARAPERVRHVKLEAFDEKAIALILDRIGSDLKQYAADVLRGNFAIFTLLGDMRDERRGDVEPLE